MNRNNWSTDNARSVSTLPLKMHYVGANLGKKWHTLNGFWSPMKGFFHIKFQTSVPNFIKIGKKNCDRESADSLTHRQRWQSDLIICPMLCYSNGTDNKVYADIRGGSIGAGTSPSSTINEVWVRGGIRRCVQLVIAIGYGQNSKLTSEKKMQWSRSA